MSDFSERDRELLARFGMTEEQVRNDVERMEDEDAVSQQQSEAALMLST